MTLNIPHPYGDGEADSWIATHRVLQFGFESLALNRMQASHLPRNPASGRVLEKVGMTREGLHRERYLKDGRFEDVVEYAVLRRDWESSNLTGRT